MRTGISFDVSASDRSRLEELIDNRNTPSKVVWRSKIILGTADGLGTNEVVPVVRTDSPLG